MINLGRAIEHPFQDRDWAVKVLIGAGVSLVPVLNFAMQGYALTVLRNTARGEDTPLPRWDALGKLFMDGLILFLVNLIYAIPVLVLVGGLMFLGLGFGVATNDMAKSTRDTLGTGFAVVGAGVGCLAALYGLLLAVIMPAVHMQVAGTGKIGPAFHPHEILALMKRNPGDYFVVVALPLAVGLIVGMGYGIVSIVPFVGICLTFMLVPVFVLVSPYIQIVLAHLYGQLLKG